MKTRTPWCQRGVEILADGQWHPGREVVASMAAVVPPGPALREAEGERQRHTPGRPRTRPLSPEAVIAVGQRAVAYVAVRARVKQGTWETNPPGVTAGTQWQVRNPKALYLTFAVVSARYGLAQDTMRKLILACEVPHVQWGRARYVHRDHLPLVEQAVADWAAGKVTGTRPALARAWADAAAAASRHDARRVTT